MGIRFEKCVLTIATGHAVYIQFAVNLARSFFYWHANSNTGFCIATDRPDWIPQDLTQQKNFELFVFPPGTYGESFTTKLWMDIMSPGQRTLFLDGDCLLTGSTDWMFEEMKGKPVATVGEKRSTGEWFGDVQKTCKQFNVQALPGFNGCLYYFENTPQAHKVFEFARDLEPAYDSLGLVRLRNKPNEELLMAISLAVHNLYGIPDNGKWYGDQLMSRGSFSLNVIKGISTLTNPPAPNPDHVPEYPFHITHPTIVHFLGGNTQKPEYKKEAICLSLIYVNKISPFWAEFIASSKVFPDFAKEILKNIFRPLYHAILGHRKIKPSDRQIS